MTSVPASMPAAPATVPAAAGAGRTFTIELPAGLPLLNSNQRLDKWTKAAITKDLRTAATLTVLGMPDLRRAIAAARPAPVFQRAHVLGIIRMDSKRRGDPANWYGSFKAAIDGALVDAGLLLDDDHEHLDGPDMRRGRTVKGAQLVLVVRELAPGQSWPDFGDVS